jgi:hypothetical protein
LIIGNVAMATGMLLFAGRTVTKLSSMIFVAVLQNCPMRTKYVFDIVIIGNVAMVTEILLFAGRTVIKLSSMIFVVVLQNCPMRTKYLFDIVFRLAVLFSNAKCTSTNSFLNAI